jgi:aspartokinase
MISTSDAIYDLLHFSPYIDELLEGRIINTSALARELQPAVEEKIGRKIHFGAILMALRRYKPKKSAKISRILFKSPPEIIVRSNLCEYTVANSHFTAKDYKVLSDLVGERQKYFVTVTQGVYETTIIASRELDKNIKKIIAAAHTVSHIDKLSSITIRLPNGAAQMSGVYYRILKPLAWEGINIVEVVATFLEFTIILHDEDVDRSFSLLKNFFKTAS